MDISLTLITRAHYISYCTSFSAISSRTTIHTDTSMDEMIDKYCLLFGVLALVLIAYFPGSVNCCSGNSNFNQEEYNFNDINTTTTVSFESTAIKNDQTLRGLARLTTRESQRTNIPTAVNLEGSTKSNDTGKRISDLNSGKA